MIIINYTVSDRDAQAYFDYAGYKTRDMREPLDRILRFIHAFEFEVFETEGGALGEEWAPLTDNPPGKGYLSQKERSHPGQPILRRDDDLWLQAITNGRVTIDSLSYEVDALNKRGFDYGEAHQTGTSKMVPRPWFDWTAEHDAMTEIAFEEWLDELRDANTRRGFAQGNIRPSEPDLGHIYTGIL